MSKIDNAVIKKVLTGKLIMLIVGIAFLLISIFCFYKVGASSGTEQENAISFAEAYDENQINDDIYVYVDVDSEPYGIGYYDNSEMYYYVTDDQGIYVMRCSKSEYESVLADIEAQGYSHVVGTISNLDEEVIEMAIETYNEGETDAEYIIDRDTFDGYFGDIAINVGGSTASEGGVSVLGIVFFIAAVFCMIIGGVGYFVYNKEISRFSDVEAQMLTAELNDPRTVYIKKANTLLTPNHIVSAGNRLTIVSYDEIMWAYRFDQSYNLIPILTNIRIYTNKFVLKNISDMSGLTFKKTEIINQILETIQAHNPQIAIGYTAELNNYFKSLKKQAKTQSKAS